METYTAEQWAQHVAETCPTRTPETWAAFVEQRRRHHAEWAAEIARRGAARRDADRLLCLTCGAVYRDRCPSGHGTAAE